MMQVRVNENSVVIEGYVNAVERDSNTLFDRTIGKFIEKICKGAFKRALQRNDDVKILLNHDKNRVLGSTKQGNLELEEDNIGLRAKATITDKEVVEKGHNGDLVGWSFGFWDRDVEKTTIKGLLHRAVKDLDLDEVSILDRTKTPAYDGTLIMTRDNDSREFHIRNEETEEGQELAEEEPLTEEEIEEQKLEELSTKIALKVVKILKGNNQEGATEEEGAFLMEQKEEHREEEKENTEEEPKQQEVVENTNTVDYSQYETMIKEMKEDK